MSSEPTMADHPAELRIGPTCYRQGRCDEMNSAVYLNLAGIFDSADVT